MRGDLLCQARLEQLVFGAVPGLHLRGEAGIVRLHLPQGEAAYFERLFRDVRVDATLFTLVEDAPCP